MTPAPPGSPDPRAAAILRAAASVLVAAAVLAPPSSNLLLGLNLWGLWSWPVRAAVGAGALAALWWPAGREAVRRAPGWVPAAAVVLLWLLAPARALVFGDSLAVSQGPGEYALTPRSPAFGALAGAVADVFPGGSAGYVQALRALAVLCGVGFSVAVWRIERRAGGFPAERAVLYLGGYLAVFAGYLEAYAPAALLVALYLAALTAERGGRRAALLVALQAAAVAAHALAVVLVPVTAWVVLRGIRWTRRRLAFAGAVGVAALAAASLAARAGLLPGALDPVRLAAFAAYQLAAAFEPRPWSWSAGVLHPQHLANVINTALLAAAPALAALVVLAARGDGRRALGRAARSPLGAAAGLLLLARLLTSTPLGPVLDWDLFALFLVPGVFWVAAAWGAPGLERVRAAGTRPLAVIGFVTLLPWVLTLHDPALSRERAVRHGDGRPALRPYVAALVRHRVTEVSVTDLAPAGQAAGFQAAYALYPRALYARQEGNAWLAAGDAERALDAFDRALALDPGDRMSRSLRATVLSRVGRAAEAEADFAALLAADPGNPWGWYGRGTLALGRGEADSARAYLERAVAGYRSRLGADTGNIASRRQLVLALILLEQWGEAERELDDLRRRTAFAAADWYHLGLARYRLGRTTEAVAALERAAALDPADRHVAATYAGAVLASGDAANAARLCTAILAGGDDAGVLLTRAEAYLRLGHRDEAAADVARALALEPANASALRMRERLGP